MITSIYFMVKIIIFTVNPFEKCLISNLIPCPCPHWMPHKFSNTVSRNFFSENDRPSDFLVVNHLIIYIFLDLFLSCLENDILIERQLADKHAFTLCPGFKTITAEINSWTVGSSFPKTRLSLTAWWLCRSPSISVGETWLFLYLSKNIYIETKELLTLT